MGHLLVSYLTEIIQITVLISLFKSRPGRLGVQICNLRFVEDTLCSTLRCLVS